MYHHVAFIYGDCCSTFIWFDFALHWTRPIHQWSLTGDGTMPIFDPFDAHTPDERLFTFSQNTFTIYFSIHTHSDSNERNYSASFRFYFDEKENDGSKSSSSSKTHSVSPKQIWTIDMEKKKPSFYTYNFCCFLIFFLVWFDLVLPTMCVYNLLLSLHFNAIAIFYIEITFQRLFYLHKAFFFGSRSFARRDRTCAIREKNSTFSSIKTLFLAN